MKKPYALLAAILMVSAVDISAAHAKRYPGGAVDSSTVKDTRFNNPPPGGPVIIVPPTIFPVAGPVVPPTIFPAQPPVAPPDYPLPVAAPPDYPFADTTKTRPVKINGPTTEPVHPVDDIGHILPINDRSKRDKLPAPVTPPQHGGGFLDPMPAPVVPIDPNAAELNQPGGPVQAPAPQLPPLVIDGPEGEIHHGNLPPVQAPAPQLPPIVITGPGELPTHGDGGTRSPIGIAIPPSGPTHLPDPTE